MKRECMLRAVWVGFFIVCSAWLTFAAQAQTSLQAQEAQPLAQDPVVEERLVNIAQELRCLVCQNESLASSRADLAEDLRREVRNLIKQGQSDEEIRAFLVSRYGDFVLYRPKVKPLTWGLWFGPFVVLLFAVLGLFKQLRSRAALTSSSLSEEERARLDAILRGK